MDGDRVREVGLTYEHYRLMPEGERYELIEGDLKLTPSPSVRHQRITRELVEIVGQYVKQNGLGEVLVSPIDVRLGDSNVVQPDVLFISADRSGILKEEYILGAPDLVIEILSPSTAQRDLVAKRAIYDRYGVREYWIVDPGAQSVEVCGRVGNALETLQVYQEGMELQSNVLKAFSLPVEKLFQT